MNPAGNTSRSSRAVPILVTDGLDQHMIETVSTQLTSRVEVVDSVFQAIYVAGTTPVNRPISTVIISEKTRFPHRDVVNAFKTVDPAVQLILIIEEANPGRSQEAMNAGFTSVIELPLERSDELNSFTMPPPPVEPSHGTSSMRTVDANKTEAHIEETERKQEIIETERAKRALEKSRRLNDERQKRQAAAPEPSPSDVLGNEPHEEEIELIRSMVERGPVVQQALNLIEKRTGLKKLHFIPIEPCDPNTLSPEVSDLIRDGSRIPIVCTHGTLGHLVTQDHDKRNLLVAWNDWLAQWILLHLHTEELEQMAWTDHLTGAGNRRALERVMDSALARAHTNDQTVTVMCFDIDNFKQYNDRFGHEAGDNVLCETVQLLNSAIRSGDHVFRVGGDEFVVVFTDRPGSRPTSSNPLESIEEIVKRFQEQVSKHPFSQIGEDAPGSLTISAGLVTYPSDGQTTRELLSKADKRAMKSKQSGKDLITFGPTGDDSASSDSKNQ